MIALKSLVAGTMLTATLWSASDATAGGHCHRTYRVPVYYQPVVHMHHHGPHGPGGPGGPGFDHDDHGGPRQGLGGPGGRGGQGGNGQGGQQGIGGQNGQGRSAAGQNGQGQNGQNQNGQNQNGQGQNGQSQNGQNQVTQNQNGQNQNQNGNNVQAVQVPSGAQVTLTGSYGTDGQVYLNINNVKLPLVVQQWTETGITLTLPSVQLTQAQSATIDVVAKNGKTDSIAITLNPQAKLVVNNQSQPANQAGSGQATANAGNVAGVQ